MSTIKLQAMKYSPKFWPEKTWKIILNLSNFQKGVLDSEPSPLESWWLVDCVTLYRGHCLEGTKHMLSKPRLSRSSIDNVIQRNMQNSPSCLPCAKCTGLAPSHTLSRLRGFPSYRKKLNVLLEYHFSYCSNTSLSWLLSLFQWASSQNLPFQMPLPLPSFCLHSVALRYQLEKCAVRL